MDRQKRERNKAFAKAAGQKRFKDTEEGKRAKKNFHDREFDKVYQFPNKIVKDSFLDYWAGKIDNELYWGDMDYDLGRTRERNDALKRADATYYQMFDASLQFMVPRVRMLWDNVTRYNYSTRSHNTEWQLFRNFVDTDDRRVSDLGQLTYSLNGEVHYPQGEKLLRALSKTMREFERITAMTPEDIARDKYIANLWDEYEDWENDDAREGNYNDFPRKFELEQFSPDEIDNAHDNWWRYEHFNDAGTQRGLNLRRERNRHFDRAFEGYDVGDINAERAMIGAEDISDGGDGDWDFYRIRGEGGEFDADAN